MRPALELADIVRHHGAAYRATHADRLGRSQRRVLSAIEACRTAPLGGHVERCTDCGVIRVAYNSCRNRHCPKCQGLARAQWLADRHAELLPVSYFHVVFTLPGPIAAIAFHNKAVVYDLLFKTAIETLRTIAIEPKYLGAEIGVIAVLHTWGQTLGHHPHVHCIVPGGGLAPDDTGWIACRPGFFLPVRVLSRLYRRRFLERLEAAFDAGALRFGGDLAGLSDPAAFAARLRPWRRVDWVVYAKRPFGGPEQVLAYLGRYTHRVAIANSRLIGLTEGRVSFRWKDYRHHDKPKVMTLEVEEFLRPFLLHVLPDGFRRIRHYGFLANGHRTAKLASLRVLLAVRPPQPVRPPAGYREPLRPSDRPLARHLSRLRRPYGRAQSTTARPERQLMIAALRPTLDVVIPSPATASVAWRSRRRRMTAPEVPASWHSAAAPARQSCPHGGVHAPTSAKPTPPQTSPRLASASAGTTTAAQRP